VYTKRLCAEFENEIRIYRLYNKNGMPIIDNNGFSDLYECSIRCHLPRYMNYSEEEKRELYKKQGKKGCNGNCKRQMTKRDARALVQKTLLHTSL
jgi:hypothetical protein